MLGLGSIIQNITTIHFVLFVKSTNILQNLAENFSTYILFYTVISNGKGSKEMGKN
jgi:hypothetical protein